LATWIGKVWAERINRDEKAEIDERMKKIEQDYEQLKIRNDYFHQVSQQTYQKLFEKKLDIYEELAKLVVEYNDTIIISFDTYDSYESTYFRRFLKINEYIRKNMLFFSSKLVERNLEIYKKLSPKIQNYYFERQIKIDNEYISEFQYEFELEMDKMEVKKFNELYKYLKHDIDSLIELIYLDLSSVTTIINNSFLVRK
jgi:hypothetical protein